VWSAGAQVPEAGGAERAGGGAVRGRRRRPLEPVAARRRTGRRAPSAPVVAKLADDLGAPAQGLQNLGARRPLLARPGCQLAFYAFVVTLNGHFMYLVFSLSIFCTLSRHFIPFYINIYTYITC
jgi:hypothetical protein